MPRAARAALAAFAALAIGAALVAPREARADIAPLETHADDVTLDARLRELELRGNVRLDSPPFHLRSDALRLRRTPHGIEVDGRGRLAFCQCLGTPVAVGFDGAVVAPPGDLLLRHPRLEVLGIPLFWFPYFWLRSPARFGLLAPDLAYRGSDGLFAGGGVHLPWGPDDPLSALDVRAGAYFRGGSAYEMYLRTPSSQTRVRYDHVGGDGLVVDARGAMVPAASAASAEGTRLDGQTLAWDIDVLRGARGVRATTALEAVARNYDRARAEGQLREGAFTFSAGLRTTSVRGGDLGTLGAWGPFVTARRAEAIGNFGTYEMTLSGGGLHAARALGPAPRPPDTPDSEMIPYLRGEAGALLATRLGAMGTSLSLRGAGNVAGGEGRKGGDGAASARAEMTFPLVRSFASEDAADPWRHRLEPRAGVAGLVVHANDALVSDFGRGRGFGGVRGGTWVAELGLSSAIGRWGRGDGFEAAASAGFVGDDARADPVMRWRAAATHPWFGLGAEGAHVLRAFRPSADLDPAGHAVVARSRIGRVDGLHLSTNIAVRKDTDPVAARLLTDAPLEPSGGFFAAPGTTGGAAASLPFSRSIVTRAGVDADLTEPRLLGTRGSIELRDRCQCIVLRVIGSHRLGRDGVDVWMTIDLTPRTSNGGP
ncbi:hypothetical protein [Pendulispora albinea]|uniref:Uncharacterized protein n=1 Tax=Pendulispora albinea TaxID=2741071 RepID=A0ABZ2M4F3_9BACT